MRGDVPRPKFLEELLEFDPTLRNVTIKFRAYDGYNKFIHPSVVAAIMEEHLDRECCIWEINF